MGSKAFIMQDIKTKKKMMALLTAVGLLLSADLSAQNQNGLFGNRAEQTGNNSLFGRNNRTQNGMEWQGGGMISQDPTQEAPLGGGLMFLTMAAVGYAVLKTKSGKEEQQ